MKRLYLLMIFGIIIASFLQTSCTSDKKTSKNNSTDSLNVDTTQQSSLDSLISQTPMPKAADELFDDFFFNFAGNYKLQKKRIKFPLKEYTGKNSKEIQANEWKKEVFFMHQGYYTLIFDNEKQAKRMKDTTLNKVSVEKIYLAKNIIKNFNFERINGLWTLVSITNNNLLSSDNASFLSFYKKFAASETFQTQSLNSPVTTVVPDPDDDFKMISGEFYPEQWVDFKPHIIPTGVIYNITYAKQNNNSKTKLFYIRGIANGLEIEMTFKKIGKNWKLIKLIS